MKNKGFILIIVGILCISFSIGLFIYNKVEDKKAESFTSEVAYELLSKIESEQKQNEIESDSDIGDSASSIPDYKLNPDIEMPTIRLMNDYYIGVLEIPSLDLVLPINETWSYPALKKTPCRYYGSAYTEDLVICAHNYSAHFGRLKSLKSGDEVIFTDANGNVFNYRVEICETLLPNSAEQMTDGEWDLSLFTCTQGGSFRVTVRCNLIEK